MYSLSLTCNDWVYASINESSWALQSCNSWYYWSWNSCIQYVNWSCTNLPTNAVFYNNTGSYSLTNASGWTTLNALTAWYLASPTINTCQFKCNSWYTNSWSTCVSSIPQAPTADTITYKTDTSIEWRYLSSPWATYYNLFYWATLMYSWALLYSNKTFLTPNTTYNFNVKACNIVGCSSATPLTAKTLIYSTYSNIDWSTTSYIPDRTDNIRFSLTWSNTITIDNITWLYWQSYYNTWSADYLSNYWTGKTWPNALTYCSWLTLAWISWWRLPDYTELLSIINYNTSTYPFIDTNHFSTQSAYYWSSTTYSITPADALLMGFSNGSTNLIPGKTSNISYVRCVH